MKGRFMQNQRLITGVELLPDGSEMQVVKVAEVTPELKLQVVYEYWRAGFERSYHGAPAEYDLGCIDE